MNCTASTSNWSAPAMHSERVPVLVTFSVTGLSNKHTPCPVCNMNDESGNLGNGGLAGGGLGGGGLGGGDRGGRGRRRRRRW